MRRITAQSIFFIAISILFVACTNYDSENYIQFEDKVIEKIIPKLLARKHLELYEWEKHDIYIIDELINEKEEVDIMYDSIIHIINDSTYLVESFESKEAVEENKLFSAFSEGKISKRKLQAGFTIQSKSFKLISNEKFRNEYNPDKTNLQAYIRLSRVVFNANKTKGYMYYQIYCGSACLWENWIEIELLDAEWHLSRSFSGGIA